MRELLLWPRRRWLAAIVGGLITAIVVGAPTALLPSPLFGRMTPIAWWSWPVLALTAILGGLVIATYVRTTATTGAGGVGAGGGLLSLLAVGCPTCNKLVVAALGMTGAVRWWAPLQPLLAVAGILVLGWALRTRLRNERGCRLSARPIGGTGAQAAPEPR